MTTPAPNDWLRVANIEDEAALQLLGRIIQADVTMLEARLVQLRELESAINERMEVLRKQKG